MAWTNGRHGTLLVTHGKTAAARRVLPMSLRVRTVLESRWECAGKPQEGWVFVAPTLSGHIEPSSLRKKHARTFAIVNAEAKKNGQPEVKSWVLYAFRHAFLTRLGESGCDTWTLAKVAGHNSIAMSSRYVHPSTDRILDVVCNLGGRNSGHTLKTALPERKEPETVTDSQ